MLRRAEQLLPRAWRCHAGRPAIHVLQPDPTPCRRCGRRHPRDRAQPRHGSVEPLQTAALGDARPATARIALKLPPRNLMSDRLLLRLHADGTLAWLAQDAGGRTLSGASAGAPPAETLARAQRIVVLVPSEQVLLLDAPVLSKQQRAARQGGAVRARGSPRLPGRGTAFLARRQVRRRFDRGAVVARDVLRGWIDTLAGARHPCRRADSGNAGAAVCRRLRHLVDRERARLAAQRGDASQRLRNREPARLARRQFAGPARGLRFPRGTGAEPAGDNCALSRAPARYAGLFRYATCVRSVAEPAAGRVRAAASPGSGAASVAAGRNARRGRAAAWIRVRVRRLVAPARRVRAPGSGDARGAACELAEIRPRRWRPAPAHAE